MIHGSLQIKKVITECHYNTLKEFVLQGQTLFLQIKSYSKTLYQIICPETFHLLGLIYNDPLHATNRNNIDLRQTLYSRLENNTIKGIIEEIYQLQ